MGSPTKTRRGFTLVELLVVIGIIAVLIGILLPTIAKARKQANTTACMATLRNLGQAIFVYASENKGSYPYSYYTSNSPPSGNAEAAADTNSGIYVWWSILRAYMRKGSNLDNSVLNNDGTTSTRFMKAFACPEGHDPENGNDYGSNMIIMPEYNWESYPAGQSVNFRAFGCTPMKQGQVYPDNILLFDQTELSNVDPAYSRQYVTGYYVDNGSFALNRQSYKRYRGMAANPNYIATGDALSNEVPIAPGTNKDVTQNDTQRGNIRWRHGKDDDANFLFADGTVRTMHITKGTPGQPDCRGDVLHRLWRPKDRPGYKANG